MRTKQDMYRLMSQYKIDHLEILKIYEKDVENGKDDVSMMVMTKEDPVQWTVLEYSEDRGFSILTVDEGMMPSSNTREELREMANANKLFDPSAGTGAMFKK